MDNRAAGKVDVPDGAVLLAALCFGFPKGGQLRRTALDPAGKPPCGDAAGDAGEVDHFGHRPIVEPSPTGGSSSDGPSNLIGEP